MRSADILHVGDLRFERLVITIAERQTPHRLASVRARVGNPLRELVVIGEQTRHVQRPSATMIAPVSVARSMTNFGLKCVARTRARRQEPDGLPRRCSELRWSGRTWTSPRRRAVAHCRPACSRQARSRPRHSRAPCARRAHHRAGDGGGAAHVALHAHHAGAGLEREATRIETHALADERDGRGSFLRARRSTA